VKNLTSWRKLTLFERDVDAIFDDFWRSFDIMMRPYYPFETRMQELGMLPVRYAPLDFIDEGDHYSIHAELPGFDKENVDVQINSDGMSIRAKKEVEKEDKKKNYLCRERAYSSFERAVSFPEEIDPAKAEGKMNNGILDLRIPKKEPKPEIKPRKLELKESGIPVFFF
jgi:HSP20 family protein